MDELSACFRQTGTNRQKGAIMRYDEYPAEYRADTYRCATHGYIKLVEDFWCPICLEDELLEGMDTEY